MNLKKCASALIRLFDPKITSIDLIRPWMDGGRDGNGKYRIGIENTSIEVDFAMQVKRYDISTAVGIRETSRLISRIKNRQFGILVTTSYLHSQTYKEIVEDGHPIIIISASDILNILRTNGLTSVELVKNWLHTV